MADLLAPPPLKVRKADEIEPLAVSLKTAAKLIGVSDRHLHKLAVAGAIPSVYVGNRRLFVVDSLRAWLREQERRACTGEAAPSHLGPPL
jgi:excisionase family DNA binding protein